MNYYYLIFPLSYFFYNARKSYLKIDGEYFINKNIVITGASQGIGKEVAEKLKNKKCNLFLLARSFNDKKEGNILYKKCDCSNPNDLNNFVRELKLKFDIVINCAGAGDWKYLTEINDKEVLQSMNAPLFSSIFTIKYLLPYLKYNAQLIFVQSPVAYQPWSSCTMYSTSRWGMRGFIESLRADYDGKGLSISEIVLAKTKSNYFINNPTAEKRFPLIGRIFGNLTVNKAADEIIWTVSKKKERHIYPNLLKSVIYIQQIFPWLVRKLVLKFDYEQ